MVCRVGSSGDKRTNHKWPHNHAFPQNNLKMACYPEGVVFTASGKL